MINTPNKRMEMDSIHSYETVCASIAMDGGDQAGLRGNLSLQFTYDIQNPSGSCQDACNASTYTIEQYTTIKQYIEVISIQELSKFQYYITEKKQKNIYMIGEIS